MGKDDILIKAGKYQHYKGGFYKVIGIAKNAGTQENMVVYKSLDESHQLWVRPYDEFRENIGEKGKPPVPRFKLIEEEAEPEI